MGIHTYTWAQLVFGSVGGGTAPGILSFSARHEHIIFIHCVRASARHPSRNKQFVKTLRTLEGGITDGRGGGLLFNAVCTSLSKTRICMHECFRVRLSLSFSLSARRGAATAGRHYKTIFSGFFVNQMRTSQKSRASRRAKMFQTQINV
jgi:hypothetical protein